MKEASGTQMPLNVPVFSCILLYSCFCCILLYSLVFFCTLLYSLVFSCILLYPLAFVCILLLFAAKIPETLVEQPFPVAAVLVPLLLAALALSITIIVVMLVVKKRQRNKKVYPVTGTVEEGDGDTLMEGLPMKTIKGGKVANGGGGDGGSSEGSDICPDITRAHSLDVLIPHGKW